MVLTEAHKQSSMTVDVTKSFFAMPEPLKPNSMLLLSRFQTVMARTEFVVSVSLLYGELSCMEMHAGS